MRWYLRVPLKFALFVGACAAFTLVSYMMLSKGITVEVPDVVGKSIKDAQLLLMERGLDIRVEADRFDRDTPAGHVIEQSVPPRTKIRGSLEVKVTLSKGPEARLISSVIGMDMDAAKKAFFENDIAMGTIIHVHSDTVAQDAVLAQHPAPDTWAGEAVNIVVSSGPRDIIYSCPLFVGKSRSDAVLLASALGLTAELSGRVIGNITAQSPDEGAAVRPGSLVSLTVGGKR